MPSFAELLTLDASYAIAKDAYRAIVRWQYRLKPDEVLQRRQRWKPTIVDYIRRSQSEGLRFDAIIRDVNRIKEYPDYGRNRHHQQGLGPYFRVQLLDTYYGGVLVGRSFGELKKLTFDDGTIGWRYLDHKSKEEGDIEAFYVGRIPFEALEAIDWEGDEHYDYPHLFCRYFSHRRGPFEDNIFCVEMARHRHGSSPYYAEVARSEDVRRLSNSTGLQHF